jgi:hypothetical protein
MKKYIFIIVFGVLFAAVVFTESDSISCQVRELGVFHCLNEAYLKSSSINILAFIGATVLGLYAIVRGIQGKSL